MTQFKATLGLDWADQQHDLWIQPADGRKAEHLRLEQTPEALHEWVARLRQRFGSGHVALGIETSRGPVISALMAYDFIVIFPINPKALKDYRGAFAVSGAKDDRTDAQLLEEFVRLHADKLHALQPDTELTRKLAGLVEKRRHLVDERTRLINQLHATLKTYYPLAETLLRGEMNSAMAADFLARWPDLESVTGAGPKALRAFFYKHNSRSAETMEKRLEAVKKARPLTTDPAIIEPAREWVVAVASMLKPLHRSILRLDQLIQQAMDEHLMRPFSGAFPRPGPRWHRVYWSPLAPNGIASRAPRKWPSSSASRRWSFKAATPKSRACATAAPSSADRPFMRTRLAPPNWSPGPAATINGKESATKTNTTRPAGHWLTN